MSKIVETVNRGRSPWDSHGLQYGSASVNTSGWKPTQLKHIKQYLEGRPLDTQILKEILIFLCLIRPETSLRLVLQLALVAYVPDDKRKALFAQLQSNLSLEDLLLEAGILTQILEADGRVGEAEEYMLFEAMQLIGLVVPSNLSGAQLLLEELSQNLANKWRIKHHLEGPLWNTQTFKKILILLCLIPPDTNLRLVLQLALAAYIPNDKQEALFAQLQSNRSLENLLLEANILTQILEADGKLGEAEENMLFEAMQLIGLVVPSDWSYARLLLEALSQNLVNEIREGGLEK